MKPRGNTLRFAISPRWQAKDATWRLLLLCASGCYETGATDSGKFGARRLTATAYRRRRCRNANSGMLRFSRL
jgi:hypothetical protein